MTVTHHFPTTQNYDDAAWWAEVYAAVFPTYKTHEVVTDKQRQKQGIDHVVTVAGGKQILVDAKVRNTYYSDVILETESAVGKTLGWLKKPLLCDFIAYAFLDNPAVYLFPFPLLQQAWRNNRDDWQRWANAKQYGFSWVDAKNTTYTTRSIAVPFKYLSAALADAQVYYRKDAA